MGTFLLEDFTPTYEALSIIYESLESDSETFKSMITTGYLMESGASKDIVMESVSDIFKTIADGIKKFIENVKKFFKKILLYITSAYQDLDKVAAEVKKVIDGKNDIEFTIDGHKFTVIDKSGPNISEFQNIVAKYNDDMTKISDLKEKEVKDEVMEWLTETNLDRLRGQVLGINQSIPDTEYLDEIRKYYRNGEDSTQSITVNRSMVDSIISNAKKLEDAKRASIKDRDNLINLLSKSETFFGRTIQTFYKGNTKQINVNKVNIDNNKFSTEDNKINVNDDMSKMISTYASYKAKQVNKIAGMINLVACERVNALKDQIKQERTILRKCLFGNTKDEKKDDIMEGYIINDNDIYYNKDKFDSGEINLCFIVGHSGSGKTSMGLNMLFSNGDGELDELDHLYCIKDRFTMEQLKKYGDLIYSYFNGVGKKFYLSHEDIKNMSVEEYEYALFPDFVHYAMKYAKSHKDKKYIVEGTWLIATTKDNTSLFNPSEFKDYAFYIKGTSSLVSKHRAAKRDSRKIANSKIDEIRSYTKGFFLNYWKWYLADEKNIQKFRKYFSSLPVSESMSSGIAGKDYSIIAMESCIRDYNVYEQTARQALFEETDFMLNALSTGKVSSLLEADTEKLGGKIKQAISDIIEMVVGNFRKKAIGTDEFNNAWMDDITKPENKLEEKAKSKKEFTMTDFFSAEYKKNISDLTSAIKTAYDNTNYNDVSWASTILPSINSPEILRDTDTRTKILNYYRTGKGEDKFETKKMSGSELAGKLKEMESYIRNYGTTITKPTENISKAFKTASDGFKVMESWSPSSYLEILGCTVSESDAILCRDYDSVFGVMEAETKIGGDNKGALAGDANKSVKNAANAVSNETQAGKETAKSATATNSVDDEKKKEELGLKQEKTNSDANAYKRMVDNFFKNCITLYLKAREEQYIAFSNALSDIDGARPKKDKNGKYIPKAEANNNQTDNNDKEVVKTETK